MQRGSLACDIRAQGVRKGLHCKAGSTDREPNLSLSSKAVLCGKEN